MALIECRECGKQVSGSAIKCPQCGVIHPNNNFWKKFSGCFIALILFITLPFILLLCSSEPEVQLPEVQLPEVQPPEVNWSKHADGFASWIRAAYQLENCIGLRNLQHEAIEYGGLDVVNFINYYTKRLKCPLDEQIESVIEQLLVTPSHNKENEVARVKWEIYQSTLKQDIDRMAKEKNCEVLKTFFDNAWGLRESELGHSPLAIYIAGKRADSGCHK